MITALTDEQQAKLIEHRDAWLSVLKDTEKADRPRAEGAIALAYEMVGRGPVPVIWFQSPLGIDIERKRIAVWPGIVNLSTKEDNRFRGTPSVASGRDDEAMFSKMVLENIKDEARGAIARLMRPLRFACDMMTSCIGQRFARTVLYNVLGQFSWDRAETVEYHQYILGAQHLKVGVGTIGVCRSVGLIIPLDDRCLACERYSSIGLDEQFLMHRDGGPAIAYSDGMKIHAFHGTPIPTEWGETPSADWDPTWLVSTENQAHRGVLINALGYDKILSRLDSKLVDRDGDMELWRIRKAVDIEPVTLLKVVCPSTKAKYCLRVPPTIVECSEARQWTFGKEIDLIKET